MFFEISKIGWFFMTPSNVLFSLLVVGFLLKGFGIGRFFLFLSVVGFAIAGFSPLGHVLLLPLEQKYPAWQAGANPAGIIVLGGSSETPTTKARGQVALNESAERLTEAAALAKRFPSAKLVFTGGNGGLLGGEGNESDDAKSVLVSLGIPESQLMFERESRNTYENATMTRSLVNPKAGDTWLLITSAWHMPRAMGVFKKAGFNVVPVPVDYRTRGWDDVTRPFTGLSEGLRRVDIAIREWAGIFTYQKVGYMDELK